MTEEAKLHMEQHPWFCCP